MRKNKIGQYSFNLDEVNATQGYTYTVETLRFRQSFVCLEPSVFDQMFFFTELTN